MVARARSAIVAFVRSIRGRSSLFTMTVVLVALVLGTFFLLQTYERGLIANLDTTLEQQVADRVALVESGGSKESLTTVFEEESFVWIGSSTGELAAHGGSVFPLENPVPRQIGQTTTVDLLVEERNSDEQNERERQSIRLASGAASSGQVVLAGSDLETVQYAVGDLARLFAIAVPLLTVLVGIVAWFTAGRALAPVDAIRRQAEDIGGSTLTERVPVPNSDDEIEGLAVTVNDMLDRIERHDGAIRQFSSDASHELKSPIANIRALVDTRSSTDPTWPALQGQLTAETERLSALVENLLFLSTHQDGDRSVTLRQVQLDELVFAEAELVSATSDVRVGFGDFEPAAVLGSQADLARLVRNLVDNAARYAQEHVEFELTTNGTTTVLSVADDGDGIDPADRERVFERFTRLDEARARSLGGTGLGLSIVKQIAEAHGASVTVGESRYGGARFEVTWHEGNDVERAQTGA